jgi:hypothetical protein
LASNNTVSRCGRHTFHPRRPASFVGKAWWQLIAILLTFAVTVIGVMVVAALLLALY